MRNFQVILRNDIIYYTLNQVVNVYLGRNINHAIGTCTVSYNGTEYIGDIQLTQDVSEDLYFYRHYLSETGDFRDIILTEEMTRDRNGNHMRTKTVGEIAI